jgi:hypothetical protein
MSDTAAPWTIERISDALGNPAIRQRFLSELNKAQIHEITAVFAKWQGVAEQLLHTAERAREFRAAELAGEPIPGEWIELTVDDLKARANRLRDVNAA